MIQHIDHVQFSKRFTGKAQVGSEGDNMNIPCHTPNFLFWEPRNGKECQADCTYGMEDWGFSGAKLQTRLGGTEGAETTKGYVSGGRGKGAFGRRAGAAHNRCVATAYAQVRCGRIGSEQRILELWLRRRIDQHSNRDKRNNGICSLWRISGKRNLEAQRPGSGHPGVWRRRFGRHESVARGRSRTWRNNVRGSDERGRAGREASHGHGEKRNETMHDERKQTNLFWTMARGCAGTGQRMRKKAETKGIRWRCGGMHRDSWSCMWRTWWTVFSKKKVPGKALWSGCCCCSEHGMSQQNERSHSSGEGGGRLTYLHMHGISLKIGTKAPKMRSRTRLFVLCQTNINKSQWLPGPGKRVHRSPAGIHDVWLRGVRLLLAQAVWIALCTGCGTQVAAADSQLSRMGGRRNREASVAAV